MATEVTVRLYFDPEPELARVFAQMVEAISTWGESNAPWQGLRVSGPQRQVIHRRDEEMQSDAVIADAARFGDGSQQLSSRISFRCWRFHGRTAELGSSLAWVEAWSDGYAQVRGEDARRIWGSAAFTIADCGPFCAEIAAEDAATAAVNERVADNLERLTALIFRIVETVKPASLKVFTDQGAYLPFNAHLAYYASEARVLEDLRLINHVWHQGLPGHQIPPFESIVDGKSVAFHWWRNDEQRRKLAAAIGGRLVRANDVDEDDVRRVVASGNFDTYSAPTGFVLLDYPYFMNAFLDRFFITLLE